ncbi:GNAT family N-acetyltransferase [Streptomyces sp. NPDC018031]|uniref:GNAT family N-acetyltransferase n=1 Tax=Streptomyces sp. NPDC018031 TaxID=3365033 RepID=UPI0037939F81
MNEGLRWIVRPERAGEAAAVRSVHAAAFPGSAQPDLVDELRAGPAWIPGLSLVAAAPDGTLAGHVALVRCLVDGATALVLTRCAVLPGRRGAGCGTALLEAALDAARARGENLVLAPEPAEHHQRSGFVPASRYRVGPPCAGADETVAALALDPARPVPGGTIAYPAAFGVPDEGLRAAPGELFAYGSLQFPEVLRPLLGRVPESRPAALPGWRAAELADRLYPGLVPAAGDSAPGRLLTGLTVRERELLDAFEDDEYHLRRLPLAGGRAAWTYVWRCGDVRDGTWSADAFRARHLADFTARCGLTG